MSESTRGLDRRTFLTGAAALGAAVLLKPALAFAEPTAADKLAEADAVRARIVDMQAQLDVVTEQYYKALDEHAAAQQAVADAQARIDEATAQIAGYQEKLGSGPAACTAPGSPRCSTSSWAPPRSRSSPRIGICWRS